MRALFFHGKYFLNRSMKNMSNVPCQHQRWVVFPFFEMADRFPANADQFCQIFLFHIVFCAVFPNPVFNHWKHLWNLSIQNKMCIRDSCRLDFGGTTADLWKI